MLDIMESVLEEGDIVNQDLLDIIFVNVVDPCRVENPASCALASKLIKRCSSVLQPFVTEVSF